MLLLLLLLLLNKKTVAVKQIIGVCCSPIAFGHF
jgi:hypothetical protein